MRFNSPTHWLFILFPLKIKHTRHSFWPHVPSGKNSIVSRAPWLQQQASWKWCSLKQLKDEFNSLQCQEIASLHTFWNTPERKGRQINNKDYNNYKQTKTNVNAVSWAWQLLPAQWSISLTATSAECFPGPQYSPCVISCCHFPLKGWGILQDISISALLCLTV